MSSLGGPSIVTSGLVLHLDAANIKSFKGEPTVNVTTGTMTPYTPYNTMTRNGQNFTFTMVGGSALYLTVHNGTDYNGQTLAFSGYMFKNGLPYALPNTYSKANTYHTATATKWYFDSVTGYFEIIELFDTSSIWLFHTPSGAVGGDIITINNFQVEVKGYVTPFVNGTRGTTVATGGGLVDRSRNSNHGEVINGPTYNSLKGGSISFDGSNDYLSVLSSTSWALTTSSTVSIWCNPTNSSGHAICFDKGSWLGWYFSMSGFFLYCGQAGADQVTTFGTMTYGVWQNLTVVVDREGLYFKTYKNGVFVAQTAIVQPAINYASTLYLGCRGGYDNFHNGKTSNLHLYNRALSATEVLQNYNATKSRFI